MYTIQKAAAMLGIPESTVRAWMEQCGIAGKVIRTDRKRLYITHNDMNMLIDHLDRKVAKREANRREQKGYNAEVIENNDSRHYQVNAEGSFYSLSGVASILDVSLNTVKGWIKQHNIDKKMLSTDRRRAYISHADVLRLADLHGRAIVKNLRADITVKQEDNHLQEEVKQKLYSLSEVAAYLNASQASVQNWIKQHNIEKKLKIADRRRVCITFNDVLLLAELHNRPVNPSISPVNVVEELKEMRSKLEKLASEVEDIKHDLRLFVKRSIYIG